MVKFHKATISKIVQAHQPRLRLKDSSSVLVALNLVMFLRKLTARSEEEMQRVHERSLRGRHIRAVSEATLAEFATPTSLGTHLRAPRA